MYLEDSKAQNCGERAKKKRSVTRVFFFPVIINRLLFVLHTLLNPATDPNASDVLLEHAHASVSCLS